ncbi:hypothetical protein [Algihabitans albus]|uniref:hypothetical protein n=1 Tax=Algihabitans albus TaxID=2164067 RepID=UPI000E5C5E66|nr:hypothetical protein [Algihabitans albus]
MNKILTGKGSEAPRPVAGTALAFGALATLALALAPLAAMAQQLPLVSRELQFHTTPAERAQEQQGSSTVSIPRVDLSNLPRVPLPAGATILPPQIDSTTGLYRDPAGERGPGGARGIVLPDAPAQQPEESLPRLVAGQVYIPPWFDDIRNVRGGRGPVEVPRDEGVRPGDLMLTPPAAPGEALPEEAPTAPQRSAAPQNRFAPNPLGTSPLGPTAQQDLTQGERPGEQPAAGLPTPQAVPTQARVVPASPQVVPPAPAQPATLNRVVPSQGQAEPASPIPLVSRKLNFQY